MASNGTPVDRRGSDEAENIAGAHDSTAHSKSRNAVRRVIDELGLSALFSASRDVDLLILQRIVRLIAYGQSTLVLTGYLHALGFTDFQMGLFMTFTLVGDIIGSAILTICADRWGRRKVLLLGSLLMSLSGVAFATGSNYYVLLIAAMVGVISPSGNEIGPFKAIEESIVASLTPREQRSSIYAWYAVLSGLAASLGSLSGGWITQYLQDKRHWLPIKSFRLIFVVYAVCGLLKALFSISLSIKCEPASKQRQVERQRYGDGEDTSETSRLLGNEPQGQGRDDTGQQGPARPPKPPKSSLVDKVLGLTPETRSKLYVLGMLFGLDNLASGLVPLSFIIYYFSTKFDLDEGTLGTTFFTTSFIAALSNLVSASLARRIGNVKTMAFTHFPSSIFLSLIPLPKSFWGARAFLIARFCTAQMDGAPRTAFLTSYIPDEERTSVMGIINVVKTLALSIGPSITGYLGGRGWIRFSFFVAGGMKASYDLMILYFFAKAAMAS